jgi:hypothetical protein
MRWPATRWWHNPRLLLAAAILLLFPIVGGVDLIVTGGERWRVVVGVLVEIALMSIAGITLVRFRRMQRRPSTGRHAQRPIE